MCHLGRGDMRQTLNILQSVVMAHGKVTLEHAYLCTGNPTPSTIESIMDMLLNDSMAESFRKLQEMQVCRCWPICMVSLHRHRLAMSACCCLHP